jgi:hypothetical protein
MDPGDDVGGVEPPDEQIDEEEVWPEDPFWDQESEAVRHLVETCEPLECADAVFNPYTPGGWDFSKADKWHAATSQVYNAGPVSLADAEQAAKEGKPNPVSAEQMRDGLLMRPNRSWPAEYWHSDVVRPWLPYAYLFQELDWDSAVILRLSNFEPRYLAALVESHPDEVRAAYQQFKEEYTKDPQAFLNQMNIWRYGSKR